MEGSGSNLIKCLHIFFNCIFCVCGATVMGVSIYANTVDGFKDELMKLFKEASIDVPLHQLTTAIWVLAAVGGFIFLTGFLGCCGAACENRLLLGIFFVIVLVLFIAELGAAIAVYAVKDTVKTEMKKGAEEIAEKANTDHELDNSLKQFEKNANCCMGDRGNATATTWKCGAKKADKPTGCTDKVFNLIENNGLIAAGISIGILFIELLAMVFTCCLCKKIHQSDSYDRYA